MVSLLVISCLYSMDQVLSTSSIFFYSCICDCILLSCNCT